MVKPGKSRQKQSKRDAILDAAEKIFIERGFAETSMSKIARTARVTKSLIHHHFGSKVQLWNEVKRRRFRQYYEVQKAAFDSATPNSEYLVEAVERFFDLFKGDPELVRLMSWHLVDTTASVESEEFELTALAVRKFIEGQQQGLIRDDIDPKYALITFFCMVIHWFQGKHEYLRWVGADPEQPGSDKEYLETIMKIFFEGILPRDESSAAAPGSSSLR